MQQTRPRRGTLTGSRETAFKFGPNDCCLHIVATRLGVFYLVIASGSQDLPRPRPNGDAVGLASVCNKLMRLEARERPDGTGILHGAGACGRLKQTPSTKDPSSRPCWARTLLRNSTSTQCVPLPFL